MSAAPFPSSGHLQPHRLRGGLIDRSRPLRARFDGKEIGGFAGDTLASALLANGNRLVGRSFKYHRPRGIFTAGPEEPNALVELRGDARREPNTRATTIEMFDGLEAASQNRWPSLRFDLLSINSLLSPLFSAGFYYKTFMWPSSFWERVYEPLIRSAAGLGRAAGEADPDHYEQAYAFCDVLIIGAGPAGLAAAQSAARSGARVIVCEQDFAIGGRLLADAREIGGVPGNVWVAGVVDELRGHAHVQLMPRTSVFAIYDGHTYGALERVSDHLPEPPPHQPRQRLWRIVAKRAILAAGAIERPIVFPGNDRPGVMMASAVRSYINRFAVRPGERIALFTNNDDGWRTAKALSTSGIDVAAVIDSRPEAPPHLKSLCPGIRVITEARVSATKASPLLRQITVATRHGSESMSVDTLAISGGWNPDIGLTCHHGGRPVWNEHLAAFVSDQAPPGLAIAGAANGRMLLHDCLAEGSEAGRIAAEDTGFAGSAITHAHVDDETFAVTPFWHLGHGKAFVDFQNDVTVDDIVLSEREGFRSVEHLKRYTTLGMATDQGKLSNVNGLAIMAALTGQAIPAVGTTSYRPPHSPVAIGALAGHSRGKQFRPIRLTPSHQWALEQKAVFVETGPWLRAQYFPHAGETGWLETVAREVRTVRSSVGFCDVSTLGKIEVHGPDAGNFLNRLYINMFSTLAVGRARYGVMLREDGLVFDDGTTSRLAKDRYFMTTTTANAGPVFQHMQFCHQVLWPELDVQFVSATDEWAQYSVAGPNARHTLAKIVDAPFSVANADFPYMAVAELKVCGGVPARLYRLSFSGELAYEIGVPTRYGDALARALMQAGEEFGITPYGTEALGLMRIEKGHVASNEIDGRTTADDIGLGRMMSAKKDFVGRVMAARPALLDPERPKLVGLRPLDADNRLYAGAHLLPVGAARLAENDQGVITSAAYSPSLNHWIGLGLLVRGAERIGHTVMMVDFMRDAFIEAEVCAPVFVDPKGERLRV
ncbi:MAG: sarcosine oxidase subunit alpha family protein [Xanthobacteraceae bacterium]